LAVVVDLFSVVQLMIPSFSFESVPLRSEKEEEEEERGGGIRTEHCTPGIFNACTYGR
jgi:hypothetical protein